MAVELWSGLGAVGLFAAPGLGLAEIFPGLRRLPLPRRLAYAYLLGIAVVAGALFALSHLFAVPLRRPAVWVAAAVPALAGLAVFCGRRGRRWRRRRHGHPLPADRPLSGAPAGAAPRTWRRRAGRLLPPLCAVPAAAVALGVLSQAASNPVTDWDGRMTWGAQARYMREAGTVDAPALREKRWFITHPQYPPLLPVAQVAALEAFGGEADSHLFRPLYAAFFPVLLLLVYDAARRRAGKPAAALAALAAALVPFFAWGEGGAATTYSDLPLACFWGGAAALLFSPRRSPADGLAAGLLLAGALLTKNEGAPLSGLVLGLALLPLRRSERRPQPPPSSAPPARRWLARWIAVLAPPLLALALLLAWRAGIPNRQDENYFGWLADRTSWTGIAAHPASFAPVLLARMFDWKDWGAFWWMAPVLLAAGARVLIRPANRRWLIAAAGAPAIGWAAYSIHPEPAYLAQVTWDRMLLQAAVPLFVALAAALRAALPADWRSRRAATGPSEPCASEVPARESD